VKNQLITQNPQNYLFQNSHPQQNQLHQNVPPQSENEIMKISQLNPCIRRDFTICALVIKKTGIREYQNAQRAGRIIKLILKDDSGFEAKAIAFDDTSEKIHNELNEEKVYYMTGGTIKTANRQ
jgi:replication factor A1